jgi:hypothetical protein
MKKSNLVLVLCITIFQIGITAYAQKVSNITFRQEQSNIIVSYDLETKTPCKVSLYVSKNGGVKWQGPLTKVIGDVGAKIVSGSNSITWNVLDEFEELKGDNIKFQVKAIVGDIETVKIGTQEWTTKNLNISRYRNGDIIPEVKDPNEWKNLTSGAWCYYDNDPKNGEIYGKLYNWYALNDRRGLAPKGYHVPSNIELNLLNDLNHSNGFFGLAGGYRYDNGTFYGIGLNGYWWSSFQNTNSTAWNRSLNYESGNTFRSFDDKSYGFSVRCIKD